MLGVTAMNDAIAGRSVADSQLEAGIFKPKDSVHCSSHSRGLPACPLTCHTKVLRPARATQHLHGCVSGESHISKRVFSSTLSQEKFDQSRTLSSQCLLSPCWVRINGKKRAARTVMVKNLSHVPQSFGQLLLITNLDMKLEKDIKTPSYVASN